MRKLHALVAGCLDGLVSSAAVAAPPGPRLWKGSDGDHALYLLGSCHGRQPPAISPTGRRC